MIYRKSYDGRRKMMKTIYETERLVLKILDSSDSKLVLDYYIRNKKFLLEWEVEKEESFYTEKHLSDRLEKDLEDIKRGSCVRLWILKKEDPDKVIGTVGFTNIVRGAFLSCYLGYKLDGEEINKGYMTEAISKGIEIMFDEFKLHRIEANIMPKNIRSMRVVEKLGFYNEGLSKKYLKINGIWEDHAHMVTLNKELE